MRNCEPLLHDLVQVDQAPNEGAMPQSMGQSYTLHAVDSVCGEQVLPPYEGDTYTRWRVIEPAVPHEWVHVV